MVRKVKVYGLDRLTVGASKRKPATDESTGKAKHPKVTTTKSAATRSKASTKG